MLRGRGLTIINEPTRTNKDDKIASCVADVNNGRIIFNAEDTDFIQQVMDFAGQDFSQHDDAPDIVSEFANRINDIVVIGRITFIDKKLLFRR